MQCLAAGEHDGSLVERWIRPGSRHVCCQAPRVVGRGQQRAKQVARLLLLLPPLHVRLRTLLQALAQIVRVICAGYTTSAAASATQQAYVRFMGYLYLSAVAVPVFQELPLSIPGRQNLTMSTCSYHSHSLCPNRGIARPDIGVRGAAPVCTDLCDLCGLSLLSQALASQLVVLHLLGGLCLQTDALCARHQEIGGMSLHTQASGSARGACLLQQRAPPPLGAAACVRRSPWAFWRLTKASAWGPARAGKAQGVIEPMLPGKCCGDRKAKSGVSQDGDAPSLLAVVAPFLEKLRLRLCLEVETPPPSLGLVYFT